MSLARSDSACSISSAAIFTIGLLAPARRAFVDQRRDPLACGALGRPRRRRRCGPGRRAPRSTSRPRGRRAGRRRSPPCAAPRDRAGWPWRAPAARSRPSAGIVKCSLQSVLIERLGELRRRLGERARGKRSASWNRSAIDSSSMKPPSHSASRMVTLCARAYSSAASPMPGSMRPCLARKFSSASSAPSSIPTYSAARGHS